MSEKQPQGSQAVVPAGERTLTTRSTSILLRGFALLDQRKERVVHFPNDVSLGKLEICDPGLWEHRTAFGEARGDVTVPAGKELYLEVHDRHALPHLQVLRADDLAHLSVRADAAAEGSLRHLRNLTNLQALDLSVTEVKVAGLVHVENLTNLQRLWLTGLAVTDAGLVHVENLTNLQILGLPFTAVTDAGLVHVEHLTNLQMLSLRGTTVTDAGLVRLEHLTNLQLLNLRKTAVTDAGVARLQLTLPRCRMNR